MAHCESRPAIVEVLAVERLITLARETGQDYILFIYLHLKLNSKYKRSKRKGHEIYIETCPHYLYLTDEALVKYGTYAKCNPALG